MIDQDLVCNVDVDLGSDLGAPVFSGNTSGRTHRVDLSCAAASDELVLVWQPPRAGDFHLAVQSTHMNAALGVVLESDYVAEQCGGGNNDAVHRVRFVRAVSLL